MNTAQILEQLIANNFNAVKVGNHEFFLSKPTRAKRMPGVAVLTEFDGTGWSNHWGVTTPLDRLPETVVDMLPLAGNYDGSIDRPTF